MNEKDLHMTEEEEADLDQRIEETVHRLERASQVDTEDRKESLAKAIKDHIIGIRKYCVWETNSMVKMVNLSFGTESIQLGGPDSEDIHEAEDKLFDSLVNLVSSTAVHMQETYERMVAEGKSNERREDQGGDQ